MKHIILDMYLDYVNDFLTVARFAEYYDMPEEKADRIINIGRKINDKLCRCIKYCENFYNVDMSPRRKIT